MGELKVIGERQAWDTILRNRGSFVPWIGAGVSIESRIPGADAICREMAHDLVDGIQKERRIRDRHPFELTPAEREDVLNDELSWSDLSARYTRSIARLYPGSTERVDYFRKLVRRGAGPSFGHYATALLITQKIFHSNCVTTNFDKLLERAFQDIGAMECQPIRSAHELDSFHKHYDDKAFCIKIHGDYDTHNLLNTEEETVIIDRRIANYLEELLRDKGALVLGSAGFEKSIHTLFDSLTSKEASNRRVLNYGLLWGIYVPDEMVDDDDDPAGLVRKVLDQGSVSREIMKVVRRNDQDLRPFAFFPVIGGAGEFLRRLIQYSGDGSLIQSAEPYFDHEMRIKAIFRKQKLPGKAALTHIRKLNEVREKLKNVPKPARPDWAYKNEPVSSGRFTLSLCYGSLADARLLDEGKPGTGRAGILSPDDTFVSIGGGTAFAIANAAGYRNMVHDVSKLAPIPLGEVAVTTAGNLPVEYVLHGASVAIGKDGVAVRTEESIRNTVRSALSKCATLGIDVLFVPLLAAGVGGASPRVSLSEILRAIAAVDHEDRPGPEALKPIKLIIVVFQESELPRTVYREQFDTIFGGVSRAGAPAADLVETRPI